MNFSDKRFRVSPLLSGKSIWDLADGGPPIPSSAALSINSLSGDSGRNPLCLATGFSWREADKANVAEVLDAGFSNESYDLVTIRTAAVSVGFTNKFEPASSDWRISKCSIGPSTGVCGVVDVVDAESLAVSVSDFLDTVDSGCLCGVLGWVGTGMEPRTME